MDMAWLDVFRTVAHLGSFTAAGERLGYTQSAISRQIATLEAELGTPLFDRLARGVRLTEHGRALLPHAEAMLERLDTTRRDLAALTELTAGRLRVGAFDSANVALVPSALAAFRAAHPQVAISLTEGLSAPLLGLLADGAIDLALLATYHADAELIDDTGQFDLSPLAEDPVLVALSRSHRLAGRRRLRLAELADEAWIAARRQPESTLLASCVRSGFQPRIEYAVANWTAKLGLVAAGLGTTLIPSLAARAARPDIALVPLHPDDTPVRHVYTAVRRGQRVPPAVTAFTGFLRAGVAAGTPPSN
ncbi:LysR family transcriptional regulator [Streptomyces rubellomurinus]|uniref:LysR family transcriptional regulator n=1 Tax=Streptomyces rubellomurinus (strain ATCC 31215) TaxID=359131 RepID=A0A0F2TKF6_STRR3|nr:LysR family transcriptional regulator [Streptomyces rubellomurinus]KJS63748.1 LysR family transcriptional regulator [Streptomyces rubellomurinus]